LRVYAKDSPSFGEGRLLKDLNGKMGTLLQRFGGSKTTTDLALELIDHQEDLKKGDKLINTRYHNFNSDYVCNYEIVINKLETIGDFKKRLFDRTQIPPEQQVISEWYNDHFYKLFANELETMASARIRKTDILRMDAIKDPLLNITEVSAAGQNSNLALQLVQFVAWDVTPYGRKEMQTTFPALLTIPDTATLFELRVAVAKRVGVPFQNVNIATSSNFPILDGYITPIKDHTKSNADLKQAELSPTAMDEDPDEIAQKLAEKENRDAKSFNFKAEKTVQLKKLRLRMLDIICWEDLRAKVPDKPTEAPATRSKKSRDGDVLKIKN